VDFANTDAHTTGQSSMQKRLSKYRRDRFEPAARVSSMSLGRFLLEEWLPRVDLSVEPSTASSYRAHVENHINPHLGHIRVGKLDRRTIQNFYATLLREKSPRTNRPLSKGSVIRLHAVLHCALEDLVFSGRLPSNPARGARPRHTKSERHEYRIWTHAELSEFLDAARDDRLYALWRVLAMTGMRRGEAVALRCSDLRLQEKLLSVRRALVIADRQLYLTRTKSDLERAIELDAQTVRALRSHIRREGRSSSEDWIFTKQRGGPLSPEQVSKAFRDLVAATDLPRIRLHDLRHTHASHLILAGVNMKTVQERLGHSDVVITLKFYSHVLPTTQREAVRKLEKLYSG
jgi:integrase